MSRPEQNWRAQPSFHLTVFLVAAVLALAMNGCTILPLHGGNTISHHFPAPKKARIAQCLRLEGLALPTNTPSAARLQASGCQAWEDRQRLTQLADISSRYPVLYLEGR